MKKLMMYQNIVMSANQPQFQFSQNKNQRRLQGHKDCEKHVRICYLSQPVIWVSSLFYVLGRNSDVNEIQKYSVTLKEWLIF